VKEQYTFSRYILSRFFHFLLPKQIHKYQDTQCGFKFFNLDQGKKLFTGVTTCNWVFDIELFILSEKNKFKVCEIPVTLSNDVSLNKSNISWWKHSWEILGDLYHIYKNIKKGKYN
jgi:hypothetical protein